MPYETLYENARGMYKEYMEKDEELWSKDDYLDTLIHLLIVNDPIRQKEFVNCNLTDINDEQKQQQMSFDEGINYLDYTTGYFTSTVNKQKNKKREFKLNAKLLPEIKNLIESGVRTFYFPDETKFLLPAIGSNYYRYNNCISRTIKKLTGYNNNTLRDKQQTDVYLKHKDDTHPFKHFKEHADRLGHQVGTAIDHYSETIPEKSSFVSLINGLDPTEYLKHENIILKTQVDMLERIIKLENKIKEMEIIKELKSF